MYFAGKKFIKTFATGDLFYALRIEPYLLATAEKDPEIDPKIKRIVEKTLAAKIALVHGDVSPKNILIGRGAPVFLDAETAWLGDPAFDAAFCLNHFLLKSVYKPDSLPEYLNCFKKFLECYLSEVNWELSEKLEERTAQLLPILTLARIDGKSPVEYLTNEQTKNRIRKIVLKFFSNHWNLDEIIEKWRIEFGRS